jgi:hypothetical protein
MTMRRPVPARVFPDGALAPGMVSFAANHAWNLT